MTGISVIIATHSQMDRLRLVLAGLEQQTLSAREFEIVVVDDASTDGTTELLTSTGLPGLQIIKPEGHLGRSQARNLGARAASGDLLVFLDGDAWPAPDLLETYSRLFAAHGRGTVLCGRQRVLGDVEYLVDPRSVEQFVPETPSVMKDWLRANRDQVVVSESDLCDGGRMLLQRSQPGGYPYPDSAERHRQARELLASAPLEGGLRWVGMIPHNCGIDSELMRVSGGFDGEISFCEGWELAYRLQNQHGCRIHAAEAETVHLYHHHRFEEAEGAHQEAMLRYTAIEYMAAKHQDEGIRLLYYWFASIWPDAFMPEACVVPGLVACDEQYRNTTAEQRRERRLILNNHPIIGHLAEA